MPGVVRPGTNIANEILNQTRILKHLASKKAKNAALGDGSQDVDVDDFISKCISFMRKGDEALLESNPAHSSRPEVGTTGWYGS